MKTYGKLFLFIACSTIVFACSNDKSQNSAELRKESQYNVDGPASISSYNDSADGYGNAIGDIITNGNTTGNVTVSENAIENKNALSNNLSVAKSKVKENYPARKFIRTADIKFRVKDVIDATGKIEDITKQYGGFVTLTKLNSQIDDQKETPVSPDSAQLTTFSSIQNVFTLRVPNSKLDTILKSFTGFTDQLDYRVITADDAALKILTNELLQQRVKENEARMKDAIRSRGRKLNETISTEDNIFEKKDQLDDAKLANLSLYEQVNFSTVTLTIYQKQIIKTELVAINKTPQPYKPGFGEQISDSFSTGWNFLMAVLIFFVRFWAIICIAVIGFVVYKLLKKNFTRLVKS